MTVPYIILPSFVLYDFEWFNFAGSNRRQTKKRRTPKMLSFFLLVALLLASDAFLLSNRMLPSIPTTKMTTSLEPTDRRFGSTDFNLLASHDDDLSKPEFDMSMILPMALPLGICICTPYVAVASTSVTVSSFDPRFFVAGGFCAAISHGMTTPIDVVKTRIQASPSQYSSGVREAAFQIIQQDGVSTLLAGLGPTVLGYGLEGAAKFGLYESLKPEIARVLGVDSNAWSFLIASMIAGAVASIILCPMERARIRLVTDPTFADNFLSAMPKLIDQVGIVGLFDGFPAMLSKQVPYTAAKQVSFDFICATMYNVLTVLGLPQESFKFDVSVSAAILTSVIACLVSHPGDVILTASYQSTSSQSFGEVMSTVFETRGFRGFFTGITARFLHVGVIITAQLVIYDSVKQFLGLPATGSS